MDVKIAGSDGNIKRTWEDYWEVFY